MSVMRAIIGPRSSGRRKVVALALLLLALLAIRLIWGAWSERKAHEALAGLRARGEAVEAADIVYAPVAEAENAWEVQLKAARSSAPISPRHTAMEYPDYPPYSDAWMKLAAASEVTNATTFALARQARQWSGVQFRPALTSPVWAMLLRPLNDAKILANTLADGINYAHVMGDDGEAIKRALDLLHLARSLRHDDFVVAQLVAIGIDALACNAIQTVAPGLRLDANAATVEQVRRLIEALLNEREAREGLIRCVAVERIAWLELCEQQARGTWVIRPLADHALVRGVPNFDALREASAAETMPAARQALARYGWQASRFDEIPRYSRWFDGDNFAGEAIVERQFRVLAERRVTAASLACQLYRAEHGRWPERLEELAPKYLARVPGDPFFEDGRAIQYVVYRGARPDGGDRPMLVWYAAEKDLGPPTEPTYGWYVDRGWPHSAGLPHQYRDVSRFLPPSPPPSTQAVEDDPEKANAPGEDEKPEDRAK
jgi:hypothetical protein